MELKLVKLKNDFNNIITLRNSVKNIFDVLQIRIDKLKIFYSEFIKNNQSEMFVFGLDSFHFQNKLIDIEYDDMKRMFLAINNRMYCEYFKLNKIIIEYILKNINDKKIIDIIKVNNFPIYKDLEPFKQYDFEIILEIHENIINSLSILMSILNNKENELAMHTSKKNIGLNIDNFITSFRYNLIVMREKIVMFITYIEFFHKLHSKYIKRFSNKIQLMYSHIENDIKFDNSIESNKNKNKELINDFNDENVDVELLKEIKKSMSSESLTSESDKDIVNKPFNSNSVSTMDSDSGSNNSISEKSTARSFSNSISNSVSNILTTTANLSSFIVSPRNKNLKNMFIKNVNKVSNVLKLGKPKENKIVNILSNEDINQLFSDINNSYTDIIETEENIGLTIDTEENIGLTIEDTEENIGLTIEDTEETEENIVYNKINISLINEASAFSNQENANNYSITKEYASEEELELQEEKNELQEEKNELQEEKNELQEEKNEVKIDIIEEAQNDSTKNDYFIEIKPNKKRHNKKKK